MPRTNRPADMVGTQEILRYSDLIAEAEAAAVVIRKQVEYKLAWETPTAAAKSMEQGLDNLIERLQGLRVGYNRTLCDPIIEADIAAEAAAIKAEEEKQRRKNAEKGGLFMPHEGSKTLAR